MRGVIVLAASLALGVAPAYATTLNDDFNDWTTQGWTVAHDTSGLAGPLANPVSANPSPPVDPSDDSGALYLPDQAYAYKYVDSTNSFLFAADVAGARFDVNRFFQAGMGYRNTHNKDTLDPCTVTSANDGMQAVTAWFEGKSPTSERMLFRDSYSTASYNDSLAVLKADPPNELGTYDVVETGRMTILYNHETGVIGDLSDGEAGYLTVIWDAIDYTPLSSYPAENFWESVPLDINDATGEVHEVNMLRLGGAYSWSQFYADNVVFLPEPASALLLIGAVPLLMRRRR